MQLPGALLSPSSKNKQKNTNLKKIIILSSKNVSFISEMELSRRKVKIKD